MIKIEVKRVRPSVMQGFAEIYINGEKVLSFGDEMYLLQKDGAFTNGSRTVKDAKHYGEVISGWGSIKPDSDFILGILYHPFDKHYNYSELVKQHIRKVEKT